MCKFCEFDKNKDWFGKDIIYTETYNNAYFQLEGIPDDDNDNIVDVALMCFQTDNEDTMASQQWDTMTIFYCPMCGRKF